MQRLYIDRFEGEYAVCETADRNQQLLPIQNLPQGAKEGDCLDIDEGGSIFINVQETLQRRENVKNLLQNLLKR